MKNDDIPKDAVRTLVFLLLSILLITSSLPSRGQQFNGTISASGYTPPPNVWVQWCRAGDNPQCRSFQLNQSIPWDGQSREGKFDRYAGGDQSVDGWNLVPAVGSEHRGGEIGLTLITLFKQKGISFDPHTNPQWFWDFSFANSCGRLSCGCSWYEKLTGEKHPIDPGCANESRDQSNSIRPCPNEPIGCGRNRNNPCITADTDIPTDRPKQVPCFSGSGRVGRWLKRIGTTEPEKPIDKPVDQTPINPAPQPVNLICLVLKIDPTTKATTIEQCK